MILRFKKNSNNLLHGLSRQTTTCIFPLILSWAMTASAQTAPSPVCPNPASVVYPPYAEAGSLPTIATWKALTRLPDDCHIILRDAALLTVAFASQFSYSGTISGIAKNIGAISTTQGLPYWSVTDHDWRELVSEAYALESNNVQSARSDFTYQEILSGKTLYFAQNDTRSWGLNAYSLRTISSSPDHMIVESHNISPVRFGPLTIFGPDDARSILFMDRLDRNTWRYYSLSVIQGSLLPLREKSVINRQAAFYRLLIGQKPDKEPAVAP